MSERVRQIRERLATVLPVLADDVRADIEELIALAEDQRRSIDEAPSIVKAGGGEEDGGDRLALSDVLRTILASATEPMWVRELTQAAVARGWTTSSAEPGKVVSACLSSRGEFTAVARGRYVLADARRSERAGAEVARRSADLEPAAPPVQSARAEPTNTPSVVLEVLRERAAPMRVGEIARAALERGWTTRSDDPAKLIGAVLRSRPEFALVGRGLYAAREATTGAADQNVLPGQGRVVEKAERRGPTPATAGAAKPAPLHALICQVLSHSGAPTRVAEIVGALRERGWTTASSHPRDVVAAVLSSRPEFVAVERGVYALRDTSPTAVERTPAEPEEAVPPSPPAPAPPVTPEAFAARRKDDLGETPDAPRSVARAERASQARLHFAPEVAHVGSELEFLLQHVADARADTAVLAPGLLRLADHGVDRSGACAERSRALARCDRASDRSRRIRAGRPVQAVVARIGRSHEARLATARRAPPVRRPAS